MQAIEDWERDDTTVSLGHSRHRLFLPEALVRPSLVVVAGEYERHCLPGWHAAGSSSSLGDRILANDRVVAS